MCPSLGKVRLAQALARAGLHLGATTVRRMIRREPAPEDVAAEEPVALNVRYLEGRKHLPIVEITTAA